MQKEHQLKVHRTSPVDARRRWGFPELPGEQHLAAKLHQLRIAALLCALILCGLLIAGLGPFRQIPNQVNWIANQPGVHYGKHGIILSSGALPAGGSGACSIEMWIRPAGGEDFRTLLAFYGPGGNVGVSLHRSLADLRLDYTNTEGKSTKAYVDKALHDGRLIFLTVASGSGGTAVYLDGALAQTVPLLRTAPGDCSGNLAVGHSARGHNSWQGDIKGLAIYGQELAPAQVLENYRSWQSTGHPDERKIGKPKALYLFSEKGGSIIRDSGSAGLSLTIPNRYMNVQRIWLESPLSAFEPRWSYAADVLINICGFVPFGFALSLLGASGHRIRMVGAWAIFGGLFVSLTIELLQVHLPTRNSDLTDILTNTFGTGLGAAIYALWRRRLVQRDELTGGQARSTETCRAASSS